jgi:hypothetical protein
MTWKIPCLNQDWRISAMEKKEMRYEISLKKSRIREINAAIDKYGYNGVAVREKRRLEREISMLQARMKEDPSKLFPSAKELEEDW